MKAIDPQSRRRRGRQMNKPGRIPHAAILGLLRMVALGPGLRAWITIGESGGE